MIERGDGEGLATCGGWTTVTRWNRWWCVCGARQLGMRGVQPDGARPERHGPSGYHIRYMFAMAVALVERQSIGATRTGSCDVTSAAVAGENSGGRDLTARALDVCWGRELDFAQAQSTTFAPIREVTACEDWASSRR